MNEECPVASLFRNVDCRNTRRSLSELGHWEEGRARTQATHRSTSRRLSHSPIWFQLANVRVTIFSSALSDGAK